MARSKVLVGTALVGVVALAGCSSSASTSDASASPNGASAAADGAVNNSASGFANFMDNNPVGNGFLSIITQGYPDITTACNPKGIGTNPIVVINYTSQPQTFNFTDNPELANLTSFVNPSQAGEFTCVGNPDDVATSAPVTVPAGQTMNTVLLAGGKSGTDTALEGQQHNMAIGGGASGNSQWYDFYLHDSGAEDNFTNWELGYENTGGLNPSQNTQPGLLNVIECSIASDGTITTGAAVINGTLTQLSKTTIATPYGSNQNRWTYNSGDPICLGFFDANADVAFNPPS